MFPKNRSRRIVLSLEKQYKRVKYKLVLTDDLIKEVVGFMKICVVFLMVYSAMASAASANTTYCNQYANTCTTTYSDGSSTSTRYNPYSNTRTTTYPDGSSTNTRYNPYSSTSTT